MNNLPIGIFDSGVGGLSVWREVKSRLRNESIIYVADSLNCPYGIKSKEEVVLLAKKNVDFLLSKNCKLIIVACNTATAAAIDFLRQNYDIPFVGMEPAIKPAALNTMTGEIGILATKGTFNGELYNNTKNTFAKNIKVHIKIGEGLVELVEKAEFSTVNARDIVRKNMSEFLKHPIDNLILGCTHYPFLIDLIKENLSKGVTIIDPAFAIAKQTKALLSSYGLINNKASANYKFYSNKDILILKNIVFGISGENNFTFEESRF